MEKLNQLNLAEKCIVGGGLLMFIAGFFEWWSYESFGYDGWGSPASIWSILAILLSLVLAGVTLAMRLGNMNPLNLPENVTWGKIYGGGAAGVVLFTLLKLWRVLAVPLGGPGIGMFLALIAAAAIAYGGYLLYTSEKTGIIRR